jgi:predicted deacylase
MLSRAFPRSSICTLVIAAAFISVLRGVAAAAEGSWGAISILGQAVAPGASQRLDLASSQSYVGAAVRTAVFVQHGSSAGPALCLTAGIHGDELNGIEIVRGLLARIDPTRLRGTLIAVPVVNVYGFQSSSRYLPDRRDLNRHFPGQPFGSSAARIAHALFAGVVRHCAALIDLHTGSQHRTNLPQVRADLTLEKVRLLAESFGAELVLHKPASSGTLRRAATDAGIAAIVYEAGEPMRFQREEIDAGVAGIQALMARLDMFGEGVARARTGRIYLGSHWVRAGRGGILLPQVELGDRVRQGQTLGVMTNLFTEERTLLRSPYDGLVIGRTLAPVMIPGYAAFHIATDTLDGAVPPPVDGETEPADEEDRSE